MVLVTDIDVGTRIVIREVPVADGKVGSFATDLNALEKLVATFCACRGQEVFLYGLAALPAVAALVAGITSCFEIACADHQQKSSRKTFD